MGAGAVSWDEVYRASNCGSQTGGGSSSLGSMCQRAHEQFKRDEGSSCIVNVGPSPVATAEGADQLVAHMASVAGCAQRCCSGAETKDACVQELSPDVGAAYDSLKSDTKSGAKNGGTKSTATQNGASTSKLSIVSAGVGGACISRKTTCALLYAKAIDLIKCKGTECDSQKGKLQKKHDACQAMSVGDIESQLTALNGATEQSNKTVDDTSSNGDGGGGGGGGGSGDGSASGSGGGDMQSMMPQLMQMAQQLMQPKPAAEITPPDCSNPATAGCMKTQSAANSWNPEKGDVGNKDASPSKGDFNVPDAPQASGYPDVPTGNGDTQSASSSGIPNGGGGMPGGGAGAAASLGGATGGGAGGAAGQGKDIDKGFRNGGGGGAGLAATNAGLSTATGGAGGGFNYNKDGGNDLNGFALASYLPGGKNAARATAGINSPKSQINDKQVNIWNRISIHFQARCSQGLLRDCIP